MKRALLGSAVVLFMAAMALPASADVDVLAEIYKDKDVVVREYIHIEKYVLLDVTVISVGDKAAEADVVGNQVNEDNEACQNCAEKVSELIDSLNDNTGISTANQATGNANNQGNLVSVAVDVGGNGNNDGGGPQDGGGFANAQASVEQRNNDNTVQATLILWRDSNIEGSVNSNAGITNFNQAAGQLNNQINATALAACLNGAVALSEADLGQATYGYEVQESSTTKSTLITDSVQSNSGVTFVNQSSGNAGNQGNVLSLAVAIHR